MIVKSLTIAVLAFAAFAAGCAGLNAGNPRALDEVADLGPFKDHSFYEVFEEQTFAGERGVYGYPKAIVVVRKGLSKADLEKVAWAYHRSNPKARIDFFDDHFNRVANRYDFRRVIDARPGHVGNMHQAIYAANIDKRAKTSQPGNFSLQMLSDGDLGITCCFLCSAFSLKHLAT